MSEGGITDMSTVEARQDLILEAQEPKFKKEQPLPPGAATLLQAAASLDVFSERTPWGDIFITDLADVIEEEGQDGEAKRRFLGTVVKSDSLKKMGEIDLSNPGNKRFSASVIGIPDVTQENSGIVEEVLSLALQRANIQIGKKDKEVKVPFSSPTGKKIAHTEIVDVPSMPGIVIGIEDGDANADLESRKKMMQRLGYKRVKVFHDKKRPGRTVWVGFRERESERKPNEANFAVAGSDISEGIIRTNEANGTVFEDTTTSDILHRTTHGNEYRSNVSSEDEREIHERVLKDVQEEKERIRRESLDLRARTQDPKDLSQKDIHELLANKNGFVRTDLTCPHPECGNHPVDKFTNVAKDTRFWLYITTVCNGAHIDGRPQYFEGSTLDKPLKYRGSYGWVKRR